MVIQGNMFILFSKEYDNPGLQKAIKSGKKPKFLKIN